MPDAPLGARAKKPVAVTYGTHTQHMRMVAERVAASLHAFGYPTLCHNLRDLAAIDLSGCAGAVLVAAVPPGKDEQAMVDFVKAQRPALERMPVALLTLSVAGASEERPEEANERRTVFVVSTQALLERFFSEAQWRPTRVQPVAGAISYRRYNFLVRLALMLLVALGAQPTGQEESEEWEAIDAFVSEFVQEIRGESQSSAAADPGK